MKTIFSKISDVQVKKQHKHIDVLVLYKIDENQRVLVIEDKTYSREHSDQIIKYIKSIKNEYKKQNLSDDDFSFAYYKTGHLFKNPIDEEQTSEFDHLTEIGNSLKKNFNLKSFRIIGLDEICKFFAEFKSVFNSNNILQNYIHYTEKLNFDFENENLPSPLNDDLELKERIDIWMNFYDSIVKDLNDKFTDLKFIFFKYNGHYASIKIESKNPIVPRIEFRSEHQELLYFYYSKDSNRQNDKDESLQE